MSTSTGPLAGVRVLDFSRVLAGPYCTMMMGDMGADVIKVEEPVAGDDTRNWGPPFLPHQNGDGQESIYFLSVNRNKRSITVNLKSNEGRDIARLLASQSHVVIENFRPGTMDRLGLGFAQLHRPNPNLVYCSVSGFGQTGPERERPGYDAVIQGEGGVMSLTGFPDSSPVKVGISFADLVAGLLAFQGILLALRVVQNGGQGQWVDVALLDGQVSLLTFQAGSYFATGRSPQRMGNLHPMITPYETYRTSDGHIIIAAGNEALWKKFCEALGKPELASDARFATSRLRVQNREALAALLIPMIAARPKAEWLLKLGAAGIPCGAVRELAEVLENPQVRAREMVTSVEHPALGSV
ncbi:MAG: CaiB/BaiF CoA transferase family protein, partial [Gammaproteobacteria bacterium]